MCRGPGGAPLWSREWTLPARGAALFCSPKSFPEKAPKCFFFAGLALLLVSSVPTVADSAAAFLGSPNFIWTVGFFLFVAFQQTREWSKGSEARDEAAKARDEAAKARDEAAKERDERMLTLLSSSFAHAEAFSEAVTYGLGVYFSSGGAPNVAPPILLWTCEELCAKLRTSPYGDYAQLFAAKSINGASALTLTEAASLVGLGVRPEHSTGMAAYLRTLCRNPAG
jgi:hypothetical protein